jgi:predicted amidophosphoribosyltransferase
VDRALLRKDYPKLSHITLIDDVITTGSTLNQIAGQLRRSGIERVDGWAIARTSATNPAR